MIGKVASSIGYGRKSKPGVRLHRPRKVGRPRTTTKKTTKKRKSGGSLRSMITSAHNFLKKHKVISTTLGQLGHPKFSSAASSLGYGKKRKTVRKRKQGGAFNLRGALSSANNFLKKHKVISTTLGQLGHPKFASAASSLGYGKKRRTMRHRGGAVYGPSEQLAKPRW